MREAVAEAPALRRDQLLGAAALLFRRRGYHSVGVDDIGAAVGMSGPAVYRYFPSKQALLRDVIAVYLVALDAERTERNERDPGTEHVLDAAIWAGQRLPDYLVAYNRELTSLDPANRAEVRSLAAGTSAGWAEFLVQHSVERHSDAGSLRLQAVAGVLLHLSLTRTGSKTRRAALAERLVAGLLDAPLPALGPERPELPRQPVRHVTTREALLAAAAALFQDRDFSRVSLRDIGASVGLTASAVSRQFESKDQLMDRRGAEDLLDRRRGGPRDHAPVRRYRAGLPRPDHDHLHAALRTRRAAAAGADPQPADVHRRARPCPAAGLPGGHPRGVAAPGRGGLLTGQ
jgi:AcrR family transcriptional regulator